MNFVRTKCLSIPERGFLPLGIRGVFTDWGYKPHYILKHLRKPLATEHFTCDVSKEHRMLMLVYVLLLVYVVYIEPEETSYTDNKQLSWPLTCHARVPNPNKDKDNMPKWSVLCTVFESKTNDLSLMQWKHHAHTTGKHLHSWEWTEANI